MNEVDTVVKCPRTIAGFRRYNQSQWEIGDALVAEVGPPSSKGVSDGSAATLRKVAEKVFEQTGMKPSPQYLARMRATAHRFPPEIRNNHVGISWAVFELVGSPKELKRVISLAKKEEAKVTIEFVKTAQHVWQDEHDEEREAKEEKARAVARRNRIKAETKLTDARTAIARTADDSKEREEAAERVKEAEEAAKKAIAKDHELPPRRRKFNPDANPPPGTGRFDLLASDLEVWGAHIAIGKVVKNLNKKVIPLIHAFDEERLNLSVDTLRESFTEIQRVLSRFEEHQSKSKRGGHLSVVEGGVRDFVREIQEFQASVLEHARAFKLTGTPSQDDLENLQCAILALHYDMRELSFELKGGKGATYEDDTAPPPVGNADGLTWNRDHPMVKTFQGGFYSYAAAPGDSDAYDVRYVTPERMKERAKGEEVPEGERIDCVRSKAAAINLIKTDWAQRRLASLPAPPLVPVLTLSVVKSEEPDTKRVLLTSDDMARPDPFAADRALINPPGSNLILDTEKPTERDYSDPIFLTI
jgi:hypothetical protein